MSLYPNVKDSSSEADTNDFLDELSRKIDPANKDLTNLFKKLQKKPNSVDLLQCMVLLLLTPEKNSPLANKLASYLKSHVELLEAITHNVELASLFLVSENGKQTFTSIHKMIINEQAARTRMFLASNGYKEPEDAYLADYQQFINNVDSLPNKLSELDETVDSALNLNDIQQLKTAYQELSALFSGCLVFNDILIKNQKAKIGGSDNFYSSSSKDQDEYTESSKENNEEIESLKKKIKHLQGENSNLASSLQNVTKKLAIKKKEVNSLKNQLGNNISLIQNQKNELTEKINMLQDKMKELTDSSVKDDYSQNNQELLSTISDLEAENKALHTKVDKLQSKVNSKDIKLDTLQEKITKIKSGSEDYSAMQKQHHNELSSLQKLYQSSTESLYKANEKNKQLETQAADLIEQLKIQKESNSDMNDMLSRAQARIKEQAGENEKLLKQMKKGSNPDSEIDKLRKDISQLKRKLIEANNFITKLQKKIENFKQKQSIIKTCHSQSKKKKVISDSESTISSINDSFVDSSSESTVTPNLDDLDKEIKKLERNVSMSRKVLHEKNTLF